MIWKNFFRDLRHTASRLISVSIITMIAVVVYTGLSGIIYNVDRLMGDYYQTQNVADHWITGTGLDRWDCRTLAAIDGITGVQPRVVLDAEDRYDSDLTLTLYGVADFSINTPYVVEGSLPQTSREIFLSDQYAAAHGLEVGDWYELTLTGLGTHLRLRICGVGKDPRSGPVRLRLCGRGGGQRGAGAQPVHSDLHHHRRRGPPLCHPHRH